MSLLSRALSSLSSFVRYPTNGQTATQPQQQNQQPTQRSAQQLSPQHLSLTSPTTTAALTSLSSLSSPPQRDNGDSKFSPMSLGLSPSVDGDKGDEKKLNDPNKYVIFVVSEEDMKPDVLRLASQRFGVFDQDNKFKDDKKVTIPPKNIRSKKDDKDLAVQRR